MKTKEEIAEYKRQWAINNKERLQEKQKLYYQNNKEKIIENTRQWQINNKEKVSENHKLYYQNNKDILYEKQKEYLKEYKQRPIFNKSKRITKWRSRGLIGDYELIYKIYKSTKFCDDCGFELNIDYRREKCMDHDHRDGLFRGIVCRCCNNRRG